MKMLVVLVIYYCITKTTSIQAAYLANQIWPTSTNQVCGWSYSQSSQLIYYSTKDVNGIFYIRKYNLTLLAADTSTPPIITFSLQQQVYCSDKILQMAGEYLIAYSSYILDYEIFNLTTGASHRYVAPFSIVTQFIYSHIRSQMYTLDEFGQFGWYTKSDILLGNFNNINFVYTFGSQIYGTLTSSQQLLAIGNINSGSVQIFNLTTNPKSILTSILYNFSNTLMITWNQNSKTIYTYDITSGYIFQEIVTTLASTNHSFSSAYTYNFHKMIHLNQTNEIFILASSYLNPTLFYFISYNFSSVSYQYSHDYGFNWKGGDIAPFTYTDSIKYAFWQDVVNLTIFSSQVYICNCTTPVLVQNVTNATNVTNITNPANITSPTNMTNITNVNVTNVTNTNITNLTNISNFQNQNEFLFNQTQIFQNYQAVLSSTLNSPMVSSINKAPASRQILKPFLTFFTNFDDLWLYYYHTKQYNAIINEIFDSVQQLERQKWQTVNVQTIWSGVFGFDVNALKTYFNQTAKSQFTSDKFLEVEGNSNGYILNSIDFFASNAFLILLTFVFGKILFVILSFFNMKMKHFFIQFSLKLYLTLMLMEGNIQYMAYLFGFQMKALVSKTHVEKTFNLAVLTINFFTLFNVVAVFYMIKYAYSKKALYLCDNFSSLDYSIFYLTAQFGIRNLILGFVHILIQEGQIYSIKLSILIFIQTSFFIFNLIYVRFSHKKCFVQKSRQWINLLTTFVRIALISLFAFCSQNSQAQILTVFSIILITYIILWVISILNQIFMIGWQIKRAMMRRKDNQAETDIQNNENLEFEKTKTQFYKVKLLSDIISKNKSNGNFQIQDLIAVTNKILTNEQNCLKTSCKQKNDNKSKINFKIVSQKNAMNNQNMLIDSKQKTLNKKKKTYIKVVKKNPNNLHFNQRLQTLEQDH